MHPNPMRLLGISTPQKFSTIVQFLPIHINLGVQIRNGDSVVNEQLVLSSANDDCRN